MNASQISTESSFPKKLVWVIVALTATITCLLIAQSFLSLRKFQKIQIHEFPMLMLSSVLVNENEDLRFSARLFSETTDPHWKKEYKQHQEHYQSAIRHLNALTPDYDKILNRDKINAVETAALTLALEKKSQEAANLLSSPAYQLGLEEYRKLLHEFEVNFGQKREHDLNRMRIQSQAIIWIVMVALLAVIALAVRLFLVVHHEIKRRREAEGERDQEKSNAIHAAKMATLGTMAGGIAHEINTPLAITLSLSEEIEELVKRDGSQTEAIGSAASQIKSTTLRIAAIIKSLRSFARDGAKDPPVQIKAQELFSSTLDLCEERMRRMDIHIINADIDPDLTFWGSSIQLSQALLNLIENAADAIKNQPVRWISLGATRKDDWIDISITDSGNGIPEAIRHQVLLPFFTTKEVGKGTGLGLSICQSIARSHGGTLEIDATNPNTRFVLRIKDAKSKQTGKTKDAHHVA